VTDIYAGLRQHIGQRRWGSCRTSHCVSRRHRG